LAQKTSPSLRSQGKAGRRLRQTLKQHQQLKEDINVRLARLDDQLYQLLARYQFYQDAIEAITHQDQGHYHPRWLFGLMANNHALMQSADTLLAQVGEIRVWVKGV